MMDDVFNPRFIRHHGFRNPMYRHCLRADGAVGSHQVAHRIHNFAINHIDRCDLNNASL
jgi:hypothetical protein